MCEEQKENILTIGFSEDSRNTVQRVSRARDMNLTAVSFDFNSDDYSLLGLVVIKDAKEFIKELVTGI